MSLKITFIGAGSLVFARTLFTDIMSVPELQKAEISFTDINPDNLEKTRELCQRDLDANGIPVVIEATTDRRAALKDARYIVNCVRVGGLEGFETDIEIPLKYGVDQCVGDTLCTGGIMYGQRVIAAMLDFCKDIREVSEPGAIMLNYSNPNAMATWACNKYGVVEVPCYVDGNGISIPKLGDLPLGCAAVCSQSIWVQKLAVEAAVHGDVSLLKQAALMDPLTGAVCNPPEIWQMIDEMLVAQEEWLPQYKEGIEAAKTNLKEHYVTPRCEGYKGAAVVREKTVEEVAAEHAKRKITV